MKVDLAALRSLIEEEIGKLEETRNQLLKQLQHISAVEEIARGVDSSPHVVEKPEPLAPNEQELTEQARKWFQQV